MANYVHFILSGKCRLIEHMLIQERTSYRGMQYELYDSEGLGPQEQLEKIFENNNMEFKKESRDVNYKSNQVRKRVFYSP